MIDIDFTRKLFDTCIENDLKIYSDDLCCQALAWLYVYGGGNEEVTQGKVRTLLLYAQKRANLMGGEVPDIEMVKKIQDYYRSLVPDHPYSEISKNLYKDPPQWVIDFENRYNLKRLK